MKLLPLTVQKRETGRSTSRAIRREGNVPGVLYKNGEVGVPVMTHPLNLRPFVYTSETRVIDLELDGDKQENHYVVKDIQFHPITDEIVHFDLLGLVEGKKLVVEVPVRLKGQSKGVRESGGILQQMLSKVMVECLPKDIPEQVEADISELDLGQSLRVKNLTGEGLTFVTNENTVVVNVLAPRKTGGGDK